MDNRDLVRKSGEIIREKVSKGLDVYSIFDDYEACLLDTSKLGRLLIDNPDFCLAPEERKIFINAFLTQSWEDAATRNFDSVGIKSDNANQEQLEKIFSIWLDVPLFYAPLFARLILGRHMREDERLRYVSSIIKRWESESDSEQKIFIPKFLRHNRLLTEDEDARLRQAQNQRVRENALKRVRASMRKHQFSLEEIQNHDQP